MPAVIYPVVVPQLLACARIYGPDVIRNSEIQNAVHFERSTFHLYVSYTSQGTGIGAVHPLESQVVQIGRIDLSQRAEPFARVIAVIGRPTIGGRPKKLCGI